MLRTPLNGVVGAAELLAAKDFPQRELVQTLTRKFSGEARHLIDLIEGAVIGKDRARFQELTHALKGTAMMAGAIGLRNSAARAEIIADSDFDSVGAGTVEDLREALEETNHELSRMLA